MQIKETADMWALRVKRRLRIPEIKQAAAECSPLIEEQIGRESLTVAGPWLFISHNLPKDGKTEFDWQICRPVIAPLSYHGQVELCHLEPIIVAARVHLGSLRTLFTQGYAPLVTEIEMSRHDFSGESREIYHDWRGGRSSFQQVEIQFGLSR